jgi:hypothetical protein
MLFFPVYTEAHPPRFAAFASRMNLRGTAFVSRADLRDAAQKDSSASLKSFNPLIFNGFRTLLHNGRPQPPCFQSLPDSFHCNGGYTPSPHAQALESRFFLRRDGARGTNRYPNHSSPTLFRINTCKSVTKQTTLTSFTINTYEKQGGRG